MPTSVEETRTGPGGWVSRLASTLEHSYLDPCSFFVSWQGVLTLAYKGFSPALAQYKGSLNSSCPELPRENPGSKWPKTSLGALKDNQRLTPQDLSALMNVCRSFQASLQSDAERVLVNHLTLVLYTCRSLEQCIERTRICLNPHGHADDSRASQSEQDNVQIVLQEADHPSYWVQASKDGNRESHYRGVALGCTLVADLFTTFRNFEKDNTSGLLHTIRAFQHQVDSVLPGMYAWFDEGSLHVTVRALMG